MSVQITAPELAAALDHLGVSAPDLSSQELAECLLVDAITTRLQAERVAASRTKTTQGETARSTQETNR
jgi:hypothetical protein